MWKELLKLWKADNLMSQAWEQSYKMLALDHEMMLEAIRVLRDSDENEMNSEIRKKDKIVNKYEREVRKKVLTHMSIHGPVSMPAGLVLITIIIDIERIGDYTKNIADLAREQKKKLKVGSYEKCLQNVESLVKDMFARVRSCIETSDREGALQALETSKSVNEMCDSEITNVIHEKDNHISPGTAASLVLYFRYLKRINSHLRNITSSIVNPFHRIGYKHKEK
jgi:phosphate uptake regulator